MVKALPLRLGVRVLLAACETLDVVKERLRRMALEKPQKRCG